MGSFFGTNQKSFCLTDKNVVEACHEMERLRQKYADKKVASLVAGLNGQDGFEKLFGPPPVGGDLARRKAIKEAMAPLLTYLGEVRRSLNDHPNKSTLTPDEALSLDTLRRNAHKSLVATYRTQRRQNLKPLSVLTKSPDPKDPYEWGSVGRIYEVARIFVGLGPKGNANPDAVFRVNWQNQVACGGGKPKDPLVGTALHHSMMAYDRAGIERVINTYHGGGGRDRATSSTATELLEYWTKAVAAAQEGTGATVASKQGNGFCGYK